MSSPIATQTLRRLRDIDLKEGLLVATLALVLCSCSSLSPTKMGRQNAETAGVAHRAVMAHRGASWYAPEGTLPAYTLACRMGADYLEADIQRSRDGHLVVVHDGTLKRTTDVKTVYPDRQDQGVGAFTLAELRTLDAGSWFNREYPDREDPSYAGVRILTLDELIAIAESASEPRPGLYLEVKSPELFPGVEEQLIARLKQRSWLGTPPAGPSDGGSGRQGRAVAERRSRVILQSFSLESVAAFARLAPEVPRVYLVSGAAKDAGWDKVLADAKRCGAGLGLNASYVSASLSQRLHREGLYLHVYTVNETERFRALTELGADGFFTDRPDELLRFYGRSGK